jgi:hypothetical protein
MYFCYLVGHCNRATRRDRPYCLYWLKHSANRITISFIPLSGIVKPILDKWRYSVLIKMK